MPDNQTIQESPAPEGGEIALVPPGPSPAEPPPRNSLGPTTPVVILTYLVGAVVYLLVKADWRTYILASPWRWGPVLGIILIVLLVLVIPSSRRKLNGMGTTGRAAILIFVAIPVSLFLVVLFIFLLPRYAFYDLRSLFLVVVVLLPGVMFYLFIVNRKTSLLNAFVANLDRLKLLPVDSAPPATLAAMPVAVLSGQRRFESYLRKFEAIYGSVSPEMLGRALDATDLDGMGDEPSSSGSSALTAETGVPVVVATLLIALGWLLTLPLKEPPAGEPWFTALAEESSAIHFAFLGAYFFSLQMLFRRYVLRDLRPSAYVAISMRIVLAVIGTWVVVAARGGTNPNQQQSLLVVGFVIGVFPPIVWQFVQSAFKKTVGAGFFLPSLRTQLPVSDLDGLTVWHEARLEEEGIENIPNMATADIVELMVQTRFPSDQIIDWVDQAILYTALGPEDGKDAANSPRRRLRAHGIRTASSLQVTYENTEPGSDRNSFEKILNSAGNGARSPIRALVETVATNPNLQLIRTWKGLPAAGRRPSSKKRET